MEMVKIHKLISIVLMNIQKQNAKLHFKDLKLIFFSF